MRRKRFTDPSQRFKLDGTVGQRLAAEAEARNMPPSKLAAMLVEIILYDKLTGAILVIEIVSRRKRAGRASITGSRLSARFQALSI